MDGLGGGQARWFHGTSFIKSFVLSNTHAGESQKEISSSSGQILPHGMREGSKLGAASSN